MTDTLQPSRSGFFRGLIAASLLSACAPAQQAHSKPPAQISELTVLPSATDSQIRAVDVPHLIMYDANAPQGKLLLFLPGTNGVPERGPKRMFEAAIAQGYRVINLSYINTPAVARICRGKNLTQDSDCTEKFRTQRVFGDRTMPLISDEPQDAIMNRFEKLLTYLASTDKDGGWNFYLKNGKPNWANISITGQSQGGGMAAFIAKKIDVSRVSTFSGGWDFSAPDTIATWYSNSSVTPPDRWYGIYHSQERMAQTIDETYRAMGIPEDHIYSLSKDVPESKRAHTQGVRNTAYADVWKAVFGDGKLIEDDK